MWCNNVGTSSAIGVASPLVRQYSCMNIWWAAAIFYTHTLGGIHKGRLFDGRGEMFSSSRHNDRLSFFYAHTHTHTIQRDYFFFSFEKKEGGDSSQEMYRKEEISYTIVRPVAFGLAHFSGPAHGGGGGDSFSCVSIPARLWRNEYTCIPRSFIRHPFFFSFSIF